MKKYLFIVAFFALVLQGCAATQLAGQAIRSGMKDIEFTATGGYDVKQLKVSKVAISTQAANDSGNALAIMMGKGNGAANDVSNNVYTDMIMNEFLKKGFDARAISDSFDLNDSSSLVEYKNKGFQIVVKGNLRLDTSTSAWGSITGGDMTYSGVKEFTLKGIDTETGKIVFIVTGSYGNAKDAKVVASDIADAFEEKTHG